MTGVIDRFISGAVPRNESCGKRRARYESSRDRAASTAAAALLAEYPCRCAIETASVRERF
jgi:hypothetical protein